MTCAWPALPAPSRAPSAPSSCPFSMQIPLRFWMRSSPTRCDPCSMPSWPWRRRPFAAGSVLGAEMLVRPGLDVVADNDLLVTDAWDLADWRWDDQPGYLTLRAPGNLSLQGNLSDGFSQVGTVLSQLAGDSWSLDLVAGADLASVLAGGVRGRLLDAPDTGSLEVGDGLLVRTGTGDIRLVAANDLILGRFDHGHLHRGRRRAAGRQRRHVPGELVPRRRRHQPRGRPGHQRHPAEPGAERLERAQSRYRRARPVGHRLRPLPPGRRCARGRHRRRDARAATS